MNFNEELYELENYEGSGFGNFLKDQSKKFIKKAGTKAIEKAVNTGGEKVGELIANKIIPPSKNNIEKTLQGQSSSRVQPNQAIKSSEIPID